MRKGCLRERERESALIPLPRVFANTTFHPQDQLIQIDKKTKLSLQTIFYSERYDLMRACLLEVEGRRRREGGRVRGFSVVAKGGWRAYSLGGVFANTTPSPQDKLIWVETKTKLLLKHFLCSQYSNDLQGSQVIFLHYALLSTSINYYSTQV